MQECPINVLVIDLETFVCCADVDTLDWIHEKSQKEDAKVIGKLSIDLEQVHRRALPSICRKSVGFQQLAPKKKTPTTSARSNTQFFARMSPGR